MRVLILVTIARHHASTSAPEEQEIEETWPPSEFQLSTFILIALAAILTGRYALFLFSGEARGHTVAFLLLCLGEFIGMAHLFGIWMTSPFSSKSPETPRTKTCREELRVFKEQLNPNRIAVFITTCGESLEIIRKTVLAARDMEVPHRTVILDDGNDPQVRELASNSGVEYFSRTEREHGKAGNVNAGLRQVDCEFFALFDSDHIPHPNFLLYTLPHLLMDVKTAFVQTPQHYSNTDGFISGGSADMQRIFYRYVQAGKNSWNAAFCVGTNVLFRRGAIDDVGGLYEQSNSEDIWTTLLLHERGWRSVFLPSVLAEGRAPETIGAQ